MDEYFIFEPFDLGYILEEVYECLMYSYSSGHTQVRIRVRSCEAIDYIQRWMPGWARRAGPGGVWRDSRGNHKIFVIFRLNEVYI